MEAIYKIEGMHCGACVGRVQKALAAIGAKADVTLDPPQVRLSGDSLPVKTRVAAAIAAAGKYNLGAEIAAQAPAAAPLAVEAPVTVAGWFATYRPLLLIVGYISIASLVGTGAGTASGFAWPVWMTNFMAGFFLVFSTSSSSIWRALPMPIRPMICWPRAGVRGVLSTRSWNWAWASPICSGWRHSRPTSRRSC